jgi:hypothetical protein
MMDHVTGLLETIGTRDRQLAAANRRIKSLEAALERIAEFNTFEEYGGFDEWLEAQAFDECKKIAKTALEPRS